MSEQPRSPLEQTDAAQARALLEIGLLASDARNSAIGVDIRFGDYQLLEKLGRGGTAIVYRARQISLNRVVALKVMLDANLKKADVQRFKFGAQAAAELDHPNIAPIYQVGEEDGVPFLSMRLLEGGTLAHALERIRRSQVSAVSLMAKVAQAVHHAHERGVLHRDLKPANIVLDESDEPFVVDFGFAKHVDERTLGSKPSMIVGTVGYMAPEQAAGDARSLTFASDIYALGTILYELLTGELPYEHLPLAELTQRLIGPQRVPSPRTIEPGIDRELEYVCLKCLEKDPRRRYATAGQLASDLQHWLTFKPIYKTSDSGLSRLLRWCRSHPALSTLIVGAVCVLTATASVALSGARKQQQLLLSKLLHANSYAADAKAGQVLSQLRALSDPVARCASDPRIASLLAKGGIPSRPARADRLLIECGANTLFDSVAVVDRTGLERARLPVRSSALRSEDVLRRDYFSAAQRLAEAGNRAVYVGRVLRSEDYGERQLSLSAPVFDEENQWLGVVSVTVNLRALLDTLRFYDSEELVVVLVGVREREPGDASGSDEQGVMVLLHGGQEDTQGLPASGPWMAELKRRHDAAAGGDALHFPEPSHHSLDDNLDAPITVFGKRWLAGFAPVGYTGYAVLVQTSYDVLIADLQDALVQLLGWSGAMLVIGASAVLLLAWVLGRRMRTRRS